MSTRLICIPVAQNLQNIIQEQIHSLSSGSTPDSQPEAQQQQQQQQAPPTMVVATPTLNSNAQAALMILLTAQMQSSQTGESSLLQNPQVVGILQVL